MRTVLLSREQTAAITERIRDARVCVVGDICLDIYWRADMTKSRLSRETPHFPLPVVSETYMPGGGGNVINNLSALGVKEIIAISAVGKDWRAYLLMDWFEKHNIATTDLYTRENGVTTCYGKPLRMGISDVVYEDPRLDFENYESISPELEKTVMDALDKAAERADIIAVSDQCLCGVITPRIRRHLSALAEKLPVVVDSRDHAAEYTGVIIKPNEVEAAFAVERDIAGLLLSVEECAKIGMKLSRKNRRPVVVTLGDRGAVWCDEGGCTLAPTDRAQPPVDIVGAGDTFLSAFCAAYAGCQNGPEAVAFANIAAGVTVKKIGTTGTATAEEIMRKWEETKRI